jgi:hypothetical protein
MSTDLKNLQGISSRSAPTVGNNAEIPVHLLEEQH